MEQHSKFTNQEPQFDLKFEVLRYLRYWYWFLLGLTISTVIAYTYLRYTPNTFAASASFKIVDNSSNSFKMPSAGGVSLFSRPRVNLENEMQILKSARLMRMVAVNLNLNEQFYALGYVNEVLCWGFKPFDVLFVTPEQSISDEITLFFEVELLETGFRFISEPYSQDFSTVIPYGQVIQTNQVSFSIQKNTHTPGYKGQKVRYIKTTYDAAAEQLNSGISVAPSGKESEILTVTTSSRTSDKNVDVLNELLRVFNQDGINDRQEISKRTISFVNERFVSLTRELDSIEFDKAGYKRTNQISYIEADASMAGSRRERANSELDQTETQMLLSRILLDALRVSGAEELLPGDLGLTNTQINTLIADYNKVILELRQAKASTGDNHPMVVKLRETLASLRQNITATIRSYETQVKMNIQQLKRIQTESLGMYSTIPEKEKTLRAIERQQEIKESLYMILLQKREEAAINLAITEPSVKVVDFAIAKKGPVAPNRKAIWLGAIAIGLLLPSGLLYLFFMTDTKLHTRKDIQLKCPEIPIAAEIPHVESGLKLVLSSDRSVLAEAFRILRTNMLYLLPTPTPGIAQVIYITSSIKSEGKTFTTTNLAVSLASLNKKVLLVGADIRNPQLHKLLGFDKNLQGVSNYLSAKVADWHTLIQRNSSKGSTLDIVFSGPIPPNPAELLSNGKFEEFLNEAKPEYDYIIVDTAPVLLVTDTLLNSNLADLTLYLCRANFTDKKLLEFSKELNTDKKLVNMAYVINDVGAGKAYGYGYGYGSSRYSYNYGYDYGYGTEQQKKLSLFKTIKRKIKRK